MGPNVQGRLIGEQGDMNEQSGKKMVFLIKKRYIWNLRGVLRKKIRYQIWILIVSDKSSWLFNIYMLVPQMKLLTVTSYWTSSETNNQY